MRAALFIFGLLCISNAQALSFAEAYNAMKTGAIVTTPTWPYQLKHINASCLQPQMPPGVTVDGEGWVQINPKAGRATTVINIGYKQYASPEWVVVP
jgi:hypothetical protein